MYHIIWHPKVYYSVRNSPLLVVTQINTVYMFPSYLFKLNFNISPVFQAIIFTQVSRPKL